MTTLRKLKRYKLGCITDSRWIYVKAPFTEYWYNIHKYMLSITYHFLVMHLIVLKLSFWKITQVGIRNQILWRLIRISVFCTTENLFDPDIRHPIIVFLHTEARVCNLGCPLPLLWLANNYIIIDETEPILTLRDQYIVSMYTHARRDDDDVQRSMVSIDLTTSSWTFSGDSLWYSWYTML